MKTTSLLLVLTGLVLTGATEATAQVSDRTKVFININVGAQPASQTLDSTFTVPKYGQTAAAATSLVIGGEPIFDIAAGYRIRQQIGVAVGFSSMSSSGTIAGTASVPSPIFFNQFKTVDIGGQAFNRTDRDVYVIFMWYVPVTNRIEIALFAGPTFAHVTQDLVTNVVVPDGTQNAVAAVESRSGTAAGANVGFDASYLFTKYYGAGIFVRYNGGSTDLATTGDSTISVKGGGFQMGIGARLRF
jgi:hypothetical protein